MKSYKDLEIYQKGLELFWKVHPLTLELPKYELYELGSQLRRSADGAVTNIVEGYGRRRYKADFIRFLTYSHSSTLETSHHLEKLIRLYPDLAERFTALHAGYEVLSSQIYRFLEYVEREWR